MSEQVYRDQPFIFGSKGIVARYALDRCPPQTYLNTQNLEARQENALSTRLGSYVVNTDPISAGNLPLGAGSVYGLARLKTQTATYRYAGCVNRLFRRTGDTLGAFTEVGNGPEFSGSRFSSLLYRPSFSSTPWIFFADQNVMRKDNGFPGLLEQWGIFPPVYPAQTTFGGILETDVDLWGSDLFDAQPTRTFTNFTPTSSSIASITRTSNTVTVVTSSPHQIPTGGPGYSNKIDITISGVTDSSFNVSLTSPFFVTDAHTFSYLQVGPNASSSGGTVGVYEIFRVNTVVTTFVPSTPGIYTVTPGSMAGISPGAVLFVGLTAIPIVVISTTVSTFTAYFPTGALSGGIGLYALETSGTVNATTTATFGGSSLFDLNTAGALHPANNNDLISLLINVSVTANLASVELDFDVGNGSFTDFYSVSFSIGSLVNNTWAQLTAARGTFTTNGLAGTFGKDWSNVGKYRIKVVTNGGGSIVLQLADLYIQNVGGPNSSGGLPYDYRYTYFNINTGDESNPCVTQIAPAFITANNQTIAVNLALSQPGDPQVTHIRIYRRGGTLNVGWLFLAQVPVGTLSYLDGFNDSDIANNQPLVLDNDPPITTQLPTPVNGLILGALTGGSLQAAPVLPAISSQLYVNQIVTIDVGNLQETVIIQSVSSGQFTAYFQYNHGVNAAIAASTRSGHPVDIGAIAFEQAWLAGDRDNPNRLYYSKSQNPEAFPPQNYVEVGVPSDPIMAIVVLRGMVFVFTLSRVYRIVVYPGQPPVPIPTSSRHGLAAKFAWCIEESQVWYRSQDGIYVFTGEDSEYLSQPIEWLLAGKEPNLGPIVADQNVNTAGMTLDTYSANVCMAYAKNEVFYSYLGQDSVRYRLIFDTVYKRWRNDSLGFLSMFYEEDTGTLLAGDGSGLVYVDRSGNVDNLGYAGSPLAPVNQNIVVTLQTPAMDQNFPKNNKIYNELVVDLDTGGAQVSIILIFNYGTNSQFPSSTYPVLTNGRQQMTISLNSGNGYTALNVSLQVLTQSGTSGALFHIYEWHIKAAVDAEFRTSYDSYWDKFGTDEPKMVKQGYFEYAANSTITFNAYEDGSAVATYSFTLPATALQRTVTRVRFPATKFKTYRLVATSRFDFMLYGESHLEVKPVTSDKGYAKAKLGGLSAQGITGGT